MTPWRLWVVWLVTFVAWPAHGAAPCEELEAAVESEKKAGESSPELPAIKQRLESLLSRCTTRDLQESGMDVTLLHRARIALASSNKKIADPMNPTHAAPEVRKPLATPKKPRQPAASNPGAVRKDGGKPEQAKSTTSKPKPQSKPELKPTESELQARRAIDSAKEAWRYLRDELLAAQDEKKRRVLTPLYVNAAMMYLEVLVRWGDPKKRDYGDVMTPLIGDSDAQAAFEIAASGSRIRRLLLDEEKAAGLERYIEVSAKLGQVSTEQGKALREAVTSKFSEDKLEALVQAWGQQQAEQLVRELDALAGVAERIEAATSTRKQMLLLLAAPNAPGDCAKSFQKAFTDALGELYGDRLRVVQVGNTGSMSDASLEQELQKHARGAECPTCDAAVAVVVRPLPDNQLQIEGRYAVLGGVQALLPSTRRVVSCDDTTSPVSTAGALFKSLLEQSTAVHSEHPLFGNGTVPIVVAAPDVAENVRFACGTFERQMPDPVRAKSIAIDNQCSADTGQALLTVLKSTGRAASLGKPGADEPTIELRRRSAETSLPERCEASLKVDGDEHLHGWAQVVRPTSNGANLDRVHDAKTGDRLALCVVSYYQSTQRPSVAPPAQPRPPRWVPALLAPGLPLVLDENPGNDWLGYSWMGADALALASSVGFAFLSIDRRNAAATSRDRDLGTADTYLTISVISGALFLVSHIASTAAFGFREEDRTRVGGAPAGTVLVW